MDTESATTSVRKETDASINSRSSRLEHEDYEPRSAQPKAVPLQLTSSRAIELSISCPKPESINIEECIEDDPHFSELPNKAEMQLRDLHAVSNGETSADLHSPGHCVVLSPVHTSAPADPEQAYSIHQLDRFPVQSSTEPDRIDSSRQQILDVVSEAVRIGESLNSPALCMVPLSILSPAFASPVLPLPMNQLNNALHQLVESSTQPSNGLDWPS